MKARTLFLGVALALVAVSGAAIAADPDALYLEHGRIVDGVLAKKSRYLNDDEANALKDIARQQKDAAKANAPAPAPDPVPPPAAGAFVRLDRNTLLDVAPAKGETTWGVMGPRAVTYWSGAALDPRRDVLIVNGGGHTDYGGNEVYEFDIATGLFARVTDPGGEPGSAHTYDGLQWAPSVGCMVRFGGSFYSSGSVTDGRPWLYCPDTKTWKPGAPVPVGWWSALEVGSDYDPETGEVLYTVSDRMLAYHPVKDAWRPVSSSGNTAYGRSAALDPVNRRLVSIGGAKAPLSFYSLAGGGRQAAPVTGNVAFKDKRHCGIAYDPSHRFAIWCGGRDVWAVDADTWVSTRYEADGPDEAHNINGIWGRWQYVPSRQAFIGWASATAPVWLYTLPPKGSPGDSADTVVLPDLQQIVDAATSVATLPAGETAQCITVRTPIAVKGPGLILKRACGDKAAIVVAADGATIDGIGAAGVTNGDNHALVRVEVPNATLRNLVSRGNDSHIMSSGARGGTLVIDGGDFADARGNVQEPGQTHGFYLGYHDYVHARGFRMVRTHREGHNVKVRAHASLFENCAVAQESAIGSRSFDYPMGGAHEIRRCSIHHGAAGNLDVIGFGHEIGGRGDVRPAPSHALTIDGAEIVCDRKPCQLVSVKAGLAVAITVRNSTLRGVALLPAYDGGGNTVQ